MPKDKSRDVTINPSYGGTVIVDNEIKDQKKGREKKVHEIGSGRYVIWDRLSGDLEWEFMGKRTGEIFIGNYMRSSRQISRKVKRRAK
jgi:hypothetical protein